MKPKVIRGVAIGGLILPLVVNAQVTLDQITNGIACYWPFDTVIEGGTKTPDIVSGKHFNLYKMTAASNLVAAADRPTAPSTNKCFAFYNAQGGVLRYVAEDRFSSTNRGTPDNPIRDFLPVVNLEEFTLNMWVKINEAAQPAADLRFFSESDFEGSASPLWVIGTSNNRGDLWAAWLLRQQGNPYVFTDGIRQTPEAGYRAPQGNAHTTSNVCDGVWRMLTVTKDINGNYTVYVDGTYDPGTGSFQDLFGTNQVLPWIWTNNMYYETNDPPEGVPEYKWKRWYWDMKCTSIGGISRYTAPSHVINGYVDDVAVWTRALTPDEVMFVYTNGLAALTELFQFTPTEISSFTADFSEVARGDIATLRWNISGATNAVISGIGPVYPPTIGSTNVQVTQPTVFTLTAYGPNEVKTASVAVVVYDGVPSNWYLLQRFDGLFSDTEQGITGYGWKSLSGDWSGALDRFNVVTMTNGQSVNKVLAPRTGYVSPPRGAYSALSLGARAIADNQSNTLFFRFAIREVDTLSDINLNIGLTDIGGVRGPGDYGRWGTGPHITILREASGYGGPIDLTINNDVGNVGGDFQWVRDRDPNGIETNVVYYLWMDIQNLETIVDTNNMVISNKDVYSVWIMKEGEMPRTLIASNFLSDRDYLNIPAWQTVYPALSELAMSVQDTYIDTNMVVFDDFYISENGFESSVPRLFEIRSIIRSASAVTIQWNSLGALAPWANGPVYKVERTTSLSSPTWNVIGTVPTGGDVTTFTDTAPPEGMAFYRIRWP